MDINFFSNVIISRIHGSLRGYTKPGEYYYKNRNAYELGFRIHGDTVSSAQGKSYTVTKNQVVFKPKGIEDSCQTETGVEFYSVWFDLENPPDYCFHIFKPQNPNAILNLFKELNTEERKNGINLKCYSILYEILHLLNFTDDYLSIQQRNLLENATNYIDENFQNSAFGISDVLSYLNISASHLRNLFHSKYAKSPVQYLIEKRINYAKTLLLYSDYSVAEISEICGFDSPFYFSRTFKKRTGIPPSSYKKEFD